jgi:uncharacterized protein (TIGR00730 family)
MSDERLNGLINDLIEEFSPIGSGSGLRRYLRALIKSSLNFADLKTSRLDLKIATTAVEEMAEAFRMFSAYRNVQKVTIFGSARIRPSDALYSLTRDLAAQLAAAGVMVITGAGPGIMAAGNEGAGPAMAMGINIRLPFEAEPNEFIANDEKLVEMKYFFTRKLMLIKESVGFLILPGGFGTMDEAFELLTLQQTGKAEPAAIVLAQNPEDTFWQGWQHFVTSEIFSRNMASPIDSALYRITDTIDDAVDELLKFNRNYVSRRFIGPEMVMRLRVAPNSAQCSEITKEFSDLLDDSALRVVSPYPVEIAESDSLQLERIAFHYSGGRTARLRQLIDRLNELIEP